MAHCGALQGRHLLHNFPFLNELWAVSFQIAIFFLASTQDNTFIFFWEEFFFNNLSCINSCDPDTYVQ